MKLRGNRPADGPKLAVCVIMHVEGQWHVMSVK